MIKSVFLVHSLKANLTRNLKQDSSSKWSEVGSLVTRNLPYLSGIFMWYVVHWYTANEIQLYATYQEACRMLRPSWAESCFPSRSSSPRVWRNSPSKSFAFGSEHVLKKEVATTANKIKTELLNIP